MSYNDLVKTYNYLFDTYAEQPNQTISAKSMTRPQMGTIRIEFELKPSPTNGEELFRPFTNLAYSRLTIKRYRARKDFIIKKSAPPDIEGLNKYLANARLATVLVNVDL